jgi:glycosyltransferase involved in cell wall biosynthesis
MREPPTTEGWLPAEFQPGLVSVVIPTFNRAELVVQTVRSVFAQTYRPLEIIVGDDASTDDTLDRLAALRPPNGVTLQTFGGEKVGACPLRNGGAAKSRGEFIMFLDSDDLLTAPALQQLVAAIPGRDMAWGPWRDMRVEQDACSLSAPFTRHFSDDWLADLLRGEWLATCSVLYRRNVLLRIAGWREDTVLDGDFHFTAQLGAAGATLATSTGVTSYYRRGGPGQISEQSYLTKTEHTQRVLQAVEQAMDAHASWTPARRGALAGRYFQSARMVWFHTGKAEKFEELVGEARRVDPEFRPPKSWYRWISAVGGYVSAERVAAIGRTLFR